MSWALGRLYCDINSTGTAVFLTDEYDLSAHVSLLQAAVCAVGLLAPPVPLALWPPSVFAVVFVPPDLLWPTCSNINSVRLPPPPPYSLIFVVKVDSSIDKYFTEFGALLIHVPPVLLGTLQSSRTRAWIGQSVE